MDFKSISFQSCNKKNFTNLIQDMGGLGLKVS